MSSVVQAMMYLVDFFLKKCYSCSGDYRDAPLWLAKNYNISCYNHPMEGDCITAALIFKIIVVKLLNAEETTKTIKENTVAL